MSVRKSTVRAAYSVGACTFLSRVAGLARDIALAAYFGVGGIMDAFFMAYMIPNLFRRLFGEGALSAAVIPILSDYKEHKTPADSTRLISGVLTLMTIALGAVTALSILVVALAGPGLLGYSHDAAGPEKWAVFQGAFIVMAPLAVLLCVSGVLAGVLNTYGKFTLPAILPALQNLLTLAFIILAGSSLLGGASTSTRIAVMCSGILGGGVLSTLWQVHSLKKAGMAVRPVMALDDPGVRQVGRAMGPTVLALAIFQVNTVIDMVMAEHFVEGEGAVSAFQFAARLFQFPLGIVAVAMSTAIFPMLARNAARNEPAKVTGGLLNGLRLLSFIVLPAAAGLMALNHEIVSVILRHGEFDQAAADRTARVLFFFSMALPIVAALQLITKAFYALKDTKTPTRVAVASVGVNIVCNYILVHTPLQEAGLALATGISGLFNLVVSAFLLRRRLKGTIVTEASQINAAGMSDRLAQPLTASGLRHFQFALFRSLAFSCLMGAAVWGVMHLFPAVEHSGLRQIGAVSVAILAGVATYTLLHLAAKSQEVGELLGKH
jgi:putative peptidoglycan lipid II flippase